MNHLKLSILAAVVAAALTSFAATASATTLSGAGGTGLGVGTEIKSESEGALTYDSPLGNLECHSNISGKIGNSGSSTSTVSVTVESFTFSECNHVLSALATGTIEIHTKTETVDSNGIVTWTGTELTSEEFGFHCIYTTNNTQIGTLTGSTTTGGNATLDISATIPRTGGRSGSFCGTSAPWTGSYKFTTPSTLNVDGTPSSAELKGEAPTGYVGETLTVTWKNVGGSSAVIDDESNSDGTVVETLGSGCGTIAAGGSCTSRKVKCLKVGEPTLAIRDTPLVEGSFTVKCDEHPLAGGPETANVGETITVTWKNNTESALVIEDEGISDGTVVETLGSSCGTISATSSCTSRKIKCLKKGEATITAADTPSTEGKFVIKCD